MPYISQEDRRHIDEFLDLGYGSPYIGNETDFDKIGQILQGVPSGKVGGAFNYFLCRLAMATFKPKGYTDLSNMLGHIQSAHDEIQRRVLDPYEDTAKANNGDLAEFTNS